MEILKNTEMPQPYNKYPWDEMQVGDCIEVDGLTRAKAATQYANRRKEGVRFRCRHMGDNRARIWRVK